MSSDHKWVVVDEGGTCIQEWRVSLGREGWEMYQSGPRRGEATLWLSVHDAYDYLLELLAEEIVNRVGRNRSLHIGVVLEAGQGVLSLGGIHAYDNGIIITSTNSVHDYSEQGTARFWPIASRQPGHSEVVLGNLKGVSIDLNLCRPARVDGGRLPMALWSTAYVSSDLQKKSGLEYCVWKDEAGNLLLDHRISGELKSRVVSGANGALVEAWDFVVLECFSLLEAAWRANLLWPRVVLLCDTLADEKRPMAALYKSDGFLFEEFFEPFPGHPMDGRDVTRK